MATAAALTGTDVINGIRWRQRVRRWAMEHGACDVPDMSRYPSWDEAWAALGKMDHMRDFRDYGGRYITDAWGATWFVLMSLSIDGRYDLPVDRPETTRHELRTKFSRFIKEERASLRHSRRLTGGPLDFYILKYCFDAPIISMFRLKDEDKFWKDWEADQAIIKAIAARF